MNILQEQYCVCRIGDAGLWHVMLPRGTAYATYLPLLCSYNHKCSDVQMAKRGIRPLKPAVKKVFESSRRPLCVVDSEKRYLTSRKGETCIATK